MLYDIHWFGVADDDWVFTRQLGILVPGDISGDIRVGVCERTGDEDTRLRQARYLIRNGHGPLFGHYQHTPHHWTEKETVKRNERKTDIQ